MKTKPIDELARSLKALSDLLVPIELRQYTDNSQFSVGSRVTPNASKPNELIF